MTTARAPRPSRSHPHSEGPTPASLLVTRLADASLPTRHGAFRMLAFGVQGESAEVVALVAGTPSEADLPLVRLHSECLTGDALGSLRCDCGEQLDASLALISREGCGVLVYLRQEGRGIGLLNKLRAYELQDTGVDTIQANKLLGLPVDARRYVSAAAVLRELGLTRIRLLTNNPAKGRALQRQGLTVVERVPLEVPANAVNDAYLQTKAYGMGHELNGRRRRRPPLIVVPSGGDPEPR